MRRTTTSLLPALAFLFAANTVATGAVLYQVNFESPFHTLNQVASTDLSAIPRHGPSLNFFGQPMIRAEPGVLDGQFLRMDQQHTSSGNFPYCQPVFELDAENGVQQYPFYRMQFDLLIHEVADSDQFIVFVDASNVQPIAFRPDQEIWAGATGKIGTYADDEPMKVRIDVDNTQRRWMIFINGTRLTYASLFNTPGSYDMRSLRFNLVADSSTSQVDVDNVLIEGLPEPAALLLFLCIWPAARRRRPLATPASAATEC